MYVLKKQKDFNRFLYHKQLKMSSKLQNKPSFQTYRLFSYRIGRVNNKQNKYKFSKTDAVDR